MQIRPYYLVKEGRFRASATLRVASTSCFETHLPSISWMPCRVLAGQRGRKSLVHSVQPSFEQSWNSPGHIVLFNPDFSYFFQSPGCQLIQRMKCSENFAGDDENIVTNLRLRRAYRKCLLHTVPPLCSRASSPGTGTLTRIHWYFQSRSFSSSNLLLSFNIFT